MIELSDEEQQLIEFLREWPIEADQQAPPGHPAAEIASGLMQIAYLGSSEGWTVRLTSNGKSREGAGATFDRAWENLSPNEGPHLTVIPGGKT